MSENFKKKQDAKKEYKIFWIAKSFILIASFLSMLFSIYLFYTDDTLKGIFVGLWVPSILSAGALLFAGNHEH
jgi:hypothetical protein